jgi:hypothetical protein
MSTTLIPTVLPSGSYIPATAWDTSAIPLLGFGTVTVAVTVAPTTTYAPQWSPDGITWFSITGIDLNLGQQSSIATGFTGAITFKAGGYFRLNGGAGGTFFISGAQ